MLKQMIMSLPLLLTFAAVAEKNVEQSTDYQKVDWQQPDCSTFTSYKSCQNSVKLKYRKMRQQEMRAHGLSFDYFERPSFSGEEVAVALKDKVSGSFVMTFDVTPKGTTQNIRLFSASSDEVLVYSESLKNAIKHWTFVPVDDAKTNVKWQTEIFFEPEQCKDEPEEGVEKVDCYAKK